MNKTKITQLHDYQENVVNLIEERFQEYLTNPPLSGTEKKPYLVPFIHSLKSITGSGKTVMLAALVSKLSSHLSYPLIL